MVFSRKCFVLFFVLSMVSQGLCRCTFSKIQIGTVRTGREIAGQPEWIVTVVNTCKCLQKQVTLSCGGYAPAKPVEPSLLQPQGNTCLLIQGAALPAGAIAQFTYAGLPYVFRPVGSTVDPSCKN